MKKVFLLFLAFSNFLIAQEVQKVEVVRTDDQISNLFNNGIDKIAQKLGEEATELVIASKNSDKKEFIYESADLLFHFLLILQKRGLKFNDILIELKNRNK